MDAEQEQEARQMEYYYVGHAGAYEDMATDFMERAGRAYTRDDEATAAQFRALSKEMSAKAKEWRAKQNEIRRTLARDRVS